MSNILSFLNNHIGKRIGLKYHIQDAGMSYYNKRVVLISKMGLSKDDLVTAMAYLFFGEEGVETKLKNGKNILFDIYTSMCNCKLFMEIFATSMSLRISITDGGKDWILDFDSPSFAQDYAQATDNVVTYYLDNLQNIEPEHGGWLDDEEVDVEDLHIYRELDICFIDGSYLTISTRHNDVDYDAYDEDGSSAEDNHISQLIHDADASYIYHGVAVFDAIKKELKIPM